LILHSGRKKRKCIPYRNDEITWFVEIKMFLNAYIPMMLEIFLVLLSVVYIAEQAGNPAHNKMGFSSSQGRNSSSYFWRKVGNSLATLGSRFEIIQKMLLEGPTNLCICPSNQYRGAISKKSYGSRIMEAIYDIAKTNNISKIELDYWVDNNAAKNFYIKSGFVKYREFVYKEI
jgi:ribosomal protein S18 acetylase RimI-like enzyme